MPFEDKKLSCVQCGKPFVFSAGEQEFFDKKGFSSPPRRCPDCRKLKRARGEKRGDDTYRSPAFENSAPDHQKIRGHGRGQGEYRAPGFKEYEHIKPEQEYRSPGFKEYEGIRPDQEYRAPGFKEYEGIKAEEEYRAPGYQELKERYADERPMFLADCAACGQKTMVPFLPEEREEVLCAGCLAKRRAAAKTVSNEPDQGVPPSTEEEQG
ncbi:MAG: zinc-ribbon domain containing protein [Deltaproteobacteria bacterium]|nr:zinc-ribbon domain containing protein [Deltaproteobacteria bacterium]